MTLKNVALIVAWVVAFVIWRWTSVGRGARRRDTRVQANVAALVKQLNAGEPITPLEVEELAARPEVRYALFTKLRDLGRSDHFPARYQSSVEQGKSALAYWMMHPNELQDAPESIEFVATFERRLDDREATFHVYRYRMASGHWASNDGWLLGLAGPMPEGVEPYSEMPGAFARASDLEDKTNPAELVDWYVGMLRQKSLAQ